MSKTDTVCRFCDRHDQKAVPAVAVAGQWAGGDEGVDPQWVPVCQEHLDHWFDDLDGEPRLPVFPLAGADFRNKITHLARTEVIGATNSARSWNDHPSFTTKGELLHRINAAQALLLAISEADGMLGARYVAGVDRLALANLGRTVKGRQKGERMDLLLVTGDLLVGLHTMATMSALPTE